MAITRIRGGQIQDRTIDGIKVKQNVLMNEHIANNAAIDESKLNINWASHTDILENKKVLDYVQINEQNVESVDSLDVTAVIGADTPAALSGNSDEGVITDAPKNAVIVRDAVTGDPILGTNGEEVYGRIVYTAEIPEVPESSPGAGDGVAAQPAKFEIKFFELDATDAEVAFVMPAGQTAKFQYLRRFNLLTVDEMFAANEKFVDGTADTNARLDLQQLAKDLYGSSWSLDHDGTTNLTRSLVDEILAQTSGVVNGAVRANAIIDEVVEARGTFGTVDLRLDNIEGTLADVENEVSIARGSEATLDARLDKIDTAIANEVQARSDLDTAVDGRLDALESGAGASNQEIVDARTSDVTGAHASLDERLEAGEAKFVADIAAEKTRAEGVEAGLQTAIEDEEARALAAEAVIQGEVDAVETDLADYKTAQAAVDLAQDGKITALETEVQDARTSSVKLEADGVTPKAFASVDERLEAIEADAVALASAGGTKDAEQDGRLDTVETDLADHKTAQATKDGEQDQALADEVAAREAADTAILTDLADVAAGKGASLVGIEDAAGKFTAVTVEGALAELYAKVEADALAEDTRLDKALNEDGTLKAGAQIHDHKKHIESIVAQTNVVNMPTGKTFQNDGTLNVYVNGILQANGVNFTEVYDVDGKGISIDFGSDPVLIGDVVILTWVVNNAE